MLQSTNYGHMKAKFLIFCVPNANSDKGLTVPKWVQIVWPKIPQMPNLSAQAQKFWISMKNGLHWASLVRATKDKPNPTAPCL